MQSVAQQTARQQVLPEGAVAPDFTAQSLGGQQLSLSAALKTGPALIVFAHPKINASRLVVGYLRRLSEIAPALPVWVFSEGREAETLEYIGSGEGAYLKMPVVLDNCGVAGLYGARFLPATYLIGADGRVIRAYSGFSRDFLNWVANEAARLTNAKAKELIADGDNKGFYELAERGPCA
jgi:hypothetical protein